jgi:Outer membrane receptor for ferrienterochelin and colicins
MKKILFIVGMLGLGVSAQAQEDTTDVFFRHLKLNEAVVTGVTGESKLGETPSPMSVLDVTALRGRASSNIIDALASEPGVSQVTTGAGISKPVIRGLGYNRVVVISDGLRQEGQQWGDEHGVEIDANDVHSVEIIKGPASLMYGSDALAGVIIFHADPNPAPDSFSAGFNSEYQSNSGLAAYSLYHGGNLNGVVWNLRFSDRYAHAYRNAADGLVPGSQFRERAVTGMTGLNRKWGFSRLTLGYYHLTPGMIEGYEEGSLEGPTGYGMELPFQQVHHYKALSDNTFLVGEGRVKMLLGFQQNRRQEYEEELDEAELDFKLNTVNYDLKYISGETDGWKVSTGINGMWQESDNLGEEVLIPAYRLLDAGLFVTASRALEKLHFSGGIRGDLRRLHSLALPGRFEDFSRGFLGLTGSAGVVWSPLPALNLRANVARGFRAPNLSELASNGVHEGTVRYERGNSDLKPEFSLQGDLGADFTSEHLSLTAAVFCNRIDNYIYAARTGEVEDGYQVYRYEADGAFLYGTELSVDCHPVHRLHLGADWSYVRGTSDGRDLPLMPAPRLAAEVKWEITHDGKVLNNSYIAFRADHRFAQEHFLPGTETATEAYTLLGASAVTDLIVRGRRAATLSIIADNLTDAVYFDHLSRLKYVGVHNPGRNVTFKLEIPIL